MYEALQSSYTLPQESDSEGGFSRSAYGGCTEAANQSPTGSDQSSCKALAGEFLTRISGARKGAPLCPQEFKWLHLLKLRERTLRQGVKLKGPDGKRPREAEATN